MSTGRHPLGLIASVLLITTCLSLASTPAKAEQDATLDSPPTTARELAESGWVPPARCDLYLAEAIENEQGYFEIHCAGRSYWQAPRLPGCVVCEPILAHGAVYTVDDNELLRRGVQEYGVTLRHVFPGTITAVDLNPNGDPQVQVEVGGSQHSWVVPPEGWLALPLSFTDGSLERSRDNALAHLARALELDSISLDSVPTALEAAAPEDQIQILNALTLSYMSDRTNPWTLAFLVVFDSAREPDIAAGAQELYVAGFRDFPESTAHELVSVALWLAAFDFELSAALLERGISAWLARGYDPQRATSTIAWAHTAGAPKPDMSPPELALRLSALLQLFPRLPHSQEAARAACGSLDAGIIATAGAPCESAAPADLGYHGFDIPGDDAPLWLIPLIPALLLGWWLAWLARLTRPLEGSTVLERGAARRRRLWGRAMPLAERMGMVALAICVGLAAWAALRTVGVISTLERAPEAVFSGFPAAPEAQEFWADAPNTAIRESMSGSLEAFAQPPVCRELPCAAAVSPTTPSEDRQRQAWSTMARRSDDLSLGALLTSPLLPLRTDSASARALAAAGSAGMFLLAVLLLAAGISGPTSRDVQHSAGFRWLPGSSPKWGFIGPLVTATFAVLIALGVTIGGAVNLASMLVPASDPLTGTALTTVYGGGTVVAALTSAGAALLAGIEFYLTREPHKAPKTA